MILHPKKNSKSIISTSILLIFLTAAIFTSCSEGSLFYSYQASDEALAILEEGNHEGLTVEENGGDYLLYPEKYQAGFIIYPGAKVECEAYLPLAKAIAEKGLFVVLIHMPCDLALFDNDAAKTYVKNYPEIKSWYLSGHSLGGAMAGSFISNAKNAALFDGIVFFAAYSTKKISSDLKVLSIYGSEDEVLNIDNYEEYRKNLPEGYTELIIEGGCHSYFGDYGHQDGDGEPSITREEQLVQTADAVWTLITALK